MSDHDVRMIMLSTEDLDASIAFYESLGMTVKFRDGTHFAALDGGSVTLALATAVDHPIPGQVVVGIKTADVDAAAAAVEAAERGVHVLAREARHDLVDPEPEVLANVVRCRFFVVIVECVQIGRAVPGRLGDEVEEPRSFPEGGHHPVLITR